MHKRTIAIPLSVLAAAGLAGGAYASTQSSSRPDPRQALLNDAAHRLHVSPSHLSKALKQASIDRINAAAASGRLTSAQAKAIKQRIEQSHGLPLLPGPAGPGPQFRFQVPAPGMFGPPAILNGAASYLGLTDQQLAQQLRSGKSLAQIASSQGQSKAGLERAITQAFRSQLARAVSAGRLPQAFEQRLLKGLTQHVQGIVNGTGRHEFRPGRGAEAPAPPLPGFGNGGITVGPPPRGLIPAPPPY